jgi:hypothetical protein
MPVRHAIDLLFAVKVLAVSMWEKFRFMEAK